MEIPTEEHLRNIGYDPFGNQTYSQLLVQWAENQCKQDAKAVCDAAHQLGWIRPTADFLELIGVRDAIRCAQGSVSGCVWTAAGLLPVGKIAKAVKLIKKGDKEAARALSCLDPNSFLPGTDVLMADGTAKDIEDLKVGDEVLATDPETGETSPQKVTAEILGEGLKNLVKIKIVDQRGQQKTVTATDNHPFWVTDLRLWVDAGNLKTGQWLRTSAGTLVQIEAIQRWTQAARVHNLSVTGPHTYYVLAGKTSVLVHNSNGCPTHVIGKGDDPLVPELVDDINAAYPGHVRAQGVDVVGADGQVLTDFDIVTRNAVVQVKTGSGKGALKQALRTQSLTDYPVIVYLPQGRGSVIKSLEQAGIMVTRDKNVLMDVLAP